MGCRVSVTRKRISTWPKKQQESDPAVTIAFYIASLLDNIFYSTPSSTDQPPNNNLLNHSSNTSVSMMMIGTNGQVFCSALIARHSIANKMSASRAMWSQAQRSAFKFDQPNHSFWKNEDGYHEAMRILCGMIWGPSCYWIGIFSFSSSQHNQVVVRAEFHTKPQRGSTIRTHGPPLLATGKWDRLEQAYEELEFMHTRLVQQKQGKFRGKF